MRIEFVLVALACLARCGSGAAPPASPVPGTADTAESDAPAPGSPEAASDSQAEFTAAEIAERLAADGRLALRSVAFESGSAVLLPESHPALGQVVLALCRDPALRLGIEVHSDSTGGEEFNLRITERRAGAIREWLVGQGIDESRLEATGCGERQPIAPNTTAQGRAANRRVEIVAL